MTQTALVHHKPAPLAFAGGTLTRDQIELLKRTVAKGTTDDEFALFIATANRLRLDPFAKQIHAVKRWSKADNREVMAIQVGIDGVRLAAIRTGELDGEDGPYWCGPDRVWVDVWLEDAPPAAAKFTVYRKGCAKPFTAVARYRSYVQTTRDGKPNSMWSRGDDFMLAKCAESLCKRKAFPEELGGVVTPEEAGNEDDAPDFQPLPMNANAPKATPIVRQSRETMDASSPAPRDPTPTQGPGSAAGEVGDREAAQRFVEGGKQIEPTAPDADAPLTDDDVALIADEMKSAKDGKVLSAIGADVAKMKVNPAQRKYLLDVYTRAQKGLPK